MLWFASSPVPIPAVVLVPFHLVQNGVNPGGGGVFIIYLNDFVSGVPFTCQRETNCFGEIFHSSVREFRHLKCLRLESAT